MSSVLIFQSLVDGLLIGGVYAVIGVGLSLAYGVMDVVNWSHGAMLMVSMYLSYFLIRLLGMDPYLTILVNIIVMSICGYFLQHVFFNRMIARGGRARLTSLLFTTGLSTALAATANALFGAEVKSVITKYSAMFSVGEVLVSQPKLIAFIVAIMATVGVHLVLQKTEIGRATRAIAIDRTTAQLMGVNSNRIFCIAFALSMALVGIAGGLMMPFYPVNPYLGTTFQFKSFVVVAIGGKGNVLGALWGGLLVGIIEKVGGLLIGETYAQILTFLLFIAILLFRPDGLLVNLPTRKAKVAK